MLNGYGGRNIKRENPRECSVLSFLCVWLGHVLATGVKNKQAVFVIGSTYNNIAYMHGKTLKYESKGHSDGS